jgi:hypothetical protein
MTSLFVVVAEKRMEACGTSEAKRCVQMRKLLLQQQRNFLSTMTCHSTQLRVKRRYLH